MESERNCEGGGGGCGATQGRLRPGEGSGSARAWKPTAWASTLLCCPRRLALLSCHHQTPHWLAASSELGIQGPNSEDSEVLRGPLQIEGGSPTPLSNGDLYCILFDGILTDLNHTDR